MNVDKSKQGCGWWVYTDTEIHCICDRHIQVSCELSHKEQINICKNCGQQWRTILTVKMINEKPLRHPLPTEEEAKQGFREAAKKYQ